MRLAVCYLGVSPHVQCTEPGALEKPPPPPPPPSSPTPCPRPLLVRGPQTHTCALCLRTGAFNRPGRQDARTPCECSRALACHLGSGCAPPPPPSPHTQTYTNLRVAGHDPAQLSATHERTAGGTGGPLAQWATVMVMVYSAAAAIGCRQAVQGAVEQERGNGGGESRAERERKGGGEHRRKMLLPAHCGGMDGEACSKEKGQRCTHTALPESRGKTVTHLTKPSLPSLTTITTTPIIDR